MKYLLTLMLIMSMLSSCKKSGASADPKSIDNTMLQGEWVLAETESANGGINKPLNKETITFKLPNHYHTSRNDIALEEGEYSFSTGIVYGGKTKNIIIFSSQPYVHTSDVIEISNDTLYMSDFLTYNAQTSIYTRR